MAAGWDALRKQGAIYKQNLIRTTEESEEEKAISELIHSHCLEILKIRKELKTDPDYFDYEALTNLYLSEEDITEFNRRKAEENGEFFMRIRLEELVDCEENLYINSGHFFVNLEHPAIAKRFQEYMDFYNLSEPLTTLQRMEFEHKCNIEFTRLRVSNDDYFKKELEKKRDELSQKLASRASQQMADFLY